MIQVVPRNGENCGGGLQMTELEKSCVWSYTFLLPISLWVTMDFLWSLQRSHSCRIFLFDKTLRSLQNNSPYFRWVVSEVQRWALIKCSTLRKSQTLPCQIKHQGCLLVQTSNVEQDRPFPPVHQEQCWKSCSMAGCQGALFYLEEDSTCSI